MYLMESLMHFEISENFGMPNVTFDSQYILTFVSYILYYDMHIWYIYTYMVHMDMCHIYVSYMCTVWRGMGIYVYGKRDKCFIIDFILKSTKNNMKPWCTNIKVTGKRKFFNKNKI